MAFATPPVHSGVKMTENAQCSTGSSLTHRPTNWIKTQVRMTKKWLLLTNLEHTGLNPMNDAVIPKLIFLTHQRKLLKKSGFVVRKIASGQKDTSRTHCYGLTWPPTWLEVRDDSNASKLITQYKLITDGNHKRHSTVCIEINTNRN